MSTDAAETNTGTAIATKVDGAIAAAAQADDFFGAVDPAMLLAAEGNVRQDEIRYPRLAIMQGLSPEIVSDTPGYEKGAIINNLTREVYTVKAKQPWLADKVPESELKTVQATVLIPILKLPDEFYKWKHRETEGPGFHLKTLDQNHPEVIRGCYPPLGRWGEKEEEKKKAPPITDNCNWLCMVTALDGRPLCDFIVATFSKTSRKAGRRFTQEATTFSRTVKRPTFYQTYILSTEFVSREKNSWYEFRTYRHKLLQQLGPRPLVMALHDQMMEVYKRCVDTTPVDPATFDPTRPTSSTNLTVGRQLQELIINSANLDEHEGGNSDEDADGGGSTAEPTTDPAF